MTAEISGFGTTPDGRPVIRVTLRNERLSVSILSLGAIVQDLRLAGADWPLTLGSGSVAAYAGPMGYFGAIVGPVANRITGARAMIGGAEHRFPANEGTTLLHGGANGTQARHWQLADHDSQSARFTLMLPDGDDGFPGNRDLSAVYALEGPTLTLQLAATSDRLTLMNLANHSYWNLDGEGTIAGQSLRVAADHYLPTVRNLPTGEVRAAEAAFDLRQPRRIDLTEGWDHNFCLASAPRPLTEVAELTGRKGIRLRLATTEPGLQVYDGRHLATAPHEGHSGAAYGPHEGIALEAQRWPDAPGNPGFPPITLHPGEAYSQTTRLSFDWPGVLP